MNNIKINETLHLININDFISKKLYIRNCYELIKKYSPYEIKVWTENDDFVKAVLSKKSRFLNYINMFKSTEIPLIANYLGIHLLYKYGGILFEMDMPLLEKIKFKEDDEFFFSDRPSTGLGPLKINKGNKLLKYYIDFLDNNFEMSMLKLYEYTLFSPDLLSNEIKENEYLPLFKKSNDFHNSHTSVWCTHLPDYFSKHNTILISENTNDMKLYSDKIVPFIINDTFDFNVRNYSRSYQIRNNEESLKLFNIYLDTMTPKVGSVINLTNFNFNRVPAKLNSESMY